jgi:hypothetical protein
LGKPFKDLEEVKTDIRMCDWAASSLGLASLIFVALGVISDAFDVALVLEIQTWLLLSIVVAIGALMPHLNFLMARYLYGIESERKKG